MRCVTYLVAIALGLVIGGTVSADDAVKHRIMFAEYGKGPNRLVELDADGKLVWEYKFPSIAVADHKLVRSIIKVRVLDDR